MLQQNIIEIYDFPLNSMFTSSNVNYVSEITVQNWKLKCHSIKAENFCVLEFIKVAKDYQ